MKIIRPGVPPGMTPITTECSRCKCEFEFHAAEAERVHDSRDGDFFRLRCPCCDAEVTKAVPR